MDTDLQEIADDWAVTFARGCPSRTVVELLANKWALYVLGALRRAGRPLRFSDLRRLLDGVTQKMLTQTLRALERDGLVSRRVYPTVPPKVEYALTELGHSAGVVTTALGDWSVAHVHEILDARQRYAERPDPEPL